MAESQVADDLFLAWCGVHVVTGTLGHPSELVVGPYTWYMYDHIW